MDLMILSSNLYSRQKKDRARKQSSGISCLAESSTYLKSNPLKQGKHSLALGLKLENSCGASNFNVNNERVSYCKILGSVETILPIITIPDRQRQLLLLERSQMHL